MKRISKEFGPVFWLHLSVIILLYSLPVLITWYFIPIVMFANIVQILIFKGCVLSKWEFREIWSEGPGFYHYYLSKIWPNLNKKKLNLFLDFVIPPLVILIGLVIQNVFNFKPFLF